VNAHVKHEMLIVTISAGIIAIESDYNVSRAAVEASWGGWRTRKRPLTLLGKGTGWGRSVTKDDNLEPRRLVAGGEDHD
jgi:hypothetical protein